MNNYKIAYLFFLLMTLTTSLTGRDILKKINQVDTSGTEQLLLYSKAYNDSIVLRWIPTTYLLWESAKKNGITIKRGTSQSDMIQIGTVFPVPKEKINRELVKKDSVAYVAENLLYGIKNRGNQTGFVNVYKENQEILNLSLLTSEFSATAANILGFRFVDKNIEKGKIYFYEISIPGINITSNTAEILNEKQKDITPLNFRIIPGDNNLILQWPKDFNKQSFNYYWIERSEDNKNFTTILSAPLLFMYQDEDNSPVFNYADSTEMVNGRKYYYRLFGGNSFGEYSLPATASGIPRDLTPPPPPDNIKVTFNDDANEFEITWDIDIENTPSDFAYYQVMMSREQNENYIAVSPKLGLSDFAYTYNLASRTEEMEGRYYFVIDCYDVAGNKSQSGDETSFVPDYTNPYAPDSLSGYVDSLSIVHLSWKRSTSKDVRGYWLYWGNSLSEELALVSKDILKDTTYQYYIPEKSLNKKIFYVVRAEDYAYNRSEVSNIAAVRRLDKVPPVKPAIRSIQTDSMMMKINISLSTSDDVRYYELYRSGSSGKDTAWVRLDTLWGQSVFIDQTAMLNTSYLYKIRAVDSTGNTSLFSPIKTGMLKVKSDVSKITDFTVKQASKMKQVVLVWNEVIPEKLKNEPFSFEVFRSDGQGGVKYHKTVPASSRTLEDPNLQSGVLYNYAVRIRYDNGWTSELSEVKSILIK